MSTFILSPDQIAAKDAVLEALLRDQFAILTGPAGSGKTTLLQRIIEFLLDLGKNIVLAAPTGKAAQVMTKILGIEASTIHKLLFRRVRSKDGAPVFGLPGPPCNPGDILIVDECSMVNREIYDILLEQLPKQSGILFVGDREQLEPVKGTWGVDLLNPSANLTQVHRQAMDNPIISYATAIRKGASSAWEDAYEGDPRLTVNNGFNGAVDDYLASLEAGKDVAFVTFTHLVRRQFNNAVRRELALDREPISAGDKLVVKANNHQLGLMNGDVVQVKEVLAEIEFKVTPYYKLALVGLAVPVKVCIPFIEAGSDAYWGFKRTRDRDDYNWLHVHYGQCLTVHSAQGGQWDDVGFLHDESFHRLLQRNREGGRRLHYTAVTRAAETLGIHFVAV